MCNDKNVLLKVEQKRAPLQLFILTYTRMQNWTFTVRFTISLQGCKFGTQVHSKITLNIIMAAKYSI